MELKIKDLSNYRKKLFLHLDGIVLLPILNFLIKNKIFDFLMRNNASLDEIADKFKINKAYGNISLRALWSSGILDYNSQNHKFSLNKNYLTILANLKPFLIDFIKILPYYKNFNLVINNSDKKYNDLLIICNNHLNKMKKILNIKDDLIHNYIYHYFEGIFIGPIISHLGFLNIINLKKIKSQQLNEIEDNIIQIFKDLNFINKTTSISTKKGEFYFKRSASYGVTVSYLETFVRIDDLLINKNYFIWDRDKEGYELHVNRTMNVWGSGGAHQFYFNKIDEIIIEIFNKKIEKQPTGIIDIGCGDGAFLEHVHDLIMKHTIRKKYKKKFPLKLVGVDINKAARDASRERLNKRNLDYIIINGNISDPKSIDMNLNNNFNLKLCDFLNARTFLDHNRIYSKPKNNISLSKKSTGGFCYKGNYISSNQLGNNLIEHLGLWKPYINKYGIIILELHTIHPNDSIKNRSKTLSCAYDTTHGFSDQYLVEYDFFIYCAKKVGLRLNDKFVYPNENIPTISISYFN